MPKELDMNRKPLDDVIEKIGEHYKSDIAEGSRYYVEVNIGKQAEMLGHRDIQEKYSDTFAVVPLKQAVPGMKVRIDGPDICELCPVRIRDCHPRIRRQGHRTGL